MLGCCLMNNTTDMVKRNLLIENLFFTKLVCGCLAEMYTN